MINDDFKWVEKSLQGLEGKDVELLLVSDWAAQFDMSRTQFTNRFIRQIGFSPDQYLRFLRLEEAKQLLAFGKSVFSRNRCLYDELIHFEGLTPDAWKKEGSGILLYYGVGRSPLGLVFVAWTKLGVHQLEFLNDPNDRGESLGRLKKRFKYANCVESVKDAQEKINSLFNPNRKDSIRLKPVGTSFQLQVWKALLDIPLGAFSTYASISKAIERDKAVRATGQAIGANPIAYLIPCHRVIRSEGSLGGYRWGLMRKRLLLAKELES